MSPKIPRKGVTFVVSIVCAVGMAWSGYSLGAFGSHRTLTVRPFVLERQLVSYTGDATGTVIRRESVGRRSDGTVFTKLIPVPGGLDAQELRTIILPEGLSYQISDAEKIRTKKTMSRAGAAFYDTIIRPSTRASAVIEGQQPPPANGKRDRAALKLGCGHPGERKAGHDVMAGYPVQIWQHESLGANQLLVRVSYYRAPGLGCLPVKEVFEERNPDGSFGVRWENVPISLQQREPDADVMDAGDSYRPVSPAEFRAATQWKSDARLNLLAFGTADPAESVVRAQPVSDRPDFNGRWQLDLMRSRGQGGGKLPYRRFTMTLAQNDPFLDVVQEVAKGKGRARVVRLALTTDGRTHTDRHLEGSASWEGQTLVLRYEVGNAAAGRQLQTVRRLTLSEDGLTMYADAQVSNAEGVTAATGTEVWHKKLHPSSPAKMQPGKTR